MPCEEPVDHHCFFSCLAHIFIYVLFFTSLLTASVFFFFFPSPPSAFIVRWAWHKVSSVALKTACGSGRGGVKDASESACVIGSRSGASPVSRRDRVGSWQTTASLRRPCRLHFIQEPMQKKPQNKTHKKSHEQNQEKAPCPPSLNIHFLCQKWDNKLI